MAKQPTKTKNRGGRPPKAPEERQSTSIIIACTSQFKAEVKRAASIYDLEMSDYIREVIAAQNAWAFSHEEEVSIDGLSPRVRDAIPRGFMLVPSPPLPPGFSSLQTEGAAPKSRKTKPA
jgi:hypothetical protein